MSQAETDNQKIEQTLQDYFDGMHYGRSELILKSFHEDGGMRGDMSDTGVREDMSRQEFVDYIDSHPTPSETGEAYDMGVHSIEITGQVAMAKVYNLYMGIMFTNYLLLVNEDDHWSILHKVWHADKPDD